MASLFPFVPFIPISVSTTKSPNHKLPTIRISKSSQKSNEILSLKKICRQGNLEEAIIFLGNSFTSQNPSGKCLDDAYSFLLELCAGHGAVSLGKQIHAHVLKSNLVYDSAFLDTKLVFMYGECGSLLDAENLFDGMRDRNIFAWNAMIGTCINNGEPFKALELYEEMRRIDFPLDAHTFPSVLKASAAIKDLCCGCEVHGLAIKLGFMSNVFVVNSLVGMYAKCNDVPAAERLFNRMSVREDVVSWNSMISAYTTSGRSAEALRLFGEMLYVGITLTTYTLVAVLQACEEPSFGKIGMAIHAIVLKSSHYLHTYVLNGLVVMYTSNNKIHEAARIFCDIKEKDNISWNSMLSGYVQNGLFGEAIDLFRKMKDMGVKPDQVSAISMLAASGRLGNVLYGMEIHAFAFKNKMVGELQVDNTLLDMYKKCGKIDYMNFVFHKMPCQDHISWTTIISGYAQNNCHVKALELFRVMQTEKMEVDLMVIGSILLACSGLKCNLLVQEIHGYVTRRGFYDIVMENTLVSAYGDCENIDYACSIFRQIQVKNVVSFTSMISCFARNGLPNEALDLVSQMKETDIQLDSVALLSILSVASDLSALRKGKEMHGFLLRNGYLIQGPIATSLLDMYASCGAVDYSITIFNYMSNKDLAIWTSMINAYGMHGCGRVAVDLLRRMKSENVLPDHITFLAVLNACSHSALVDEGKHIFESMQREFKLEPWPEHYTCMVDMLGRSNYLEEAFQFVKTMKMEPTAAVWCALLGACRIHSHEEIGKIAASELLKLEPENPGNYVLVSNAYAATDRWEDAGEVRITMKGKGLKKDPACSWIEVQNKIHTFIAHDKCHPESDKIYQKLNQITEKLVREGGYTPQTEYILHNVSEEEKFELLYGHSERLAISYGLLETAYGTTVRITKNLRICGDCHTFSKLISKHLEREIIVRDTNRFHHFRDGVCSCGDFW